MKLFFEDKMNESKDSKYYYDAFRRIIHDMFEMGLESDQVKECFKEAFDYEESLFE